MIIDNATNLDEQSWTKLLNEKDENGIIIKKIDHAKTANSITPPHKTSKSILDSFQKQLRMSIKSVNDSPKALSRYRQTRSSSRRVRKRVIFKHGDCNVIQGNVAKRRRKYMQDIFTTLVDAQWRWTLLVFALSFLLSWTAFGCLWWIITYAHGDLEYDQLSENLKNTGNNSTSNLSEHIACVTQIHGFTSAFLFSVETQHTIGYGNRYLTEECPEAIFLMCLQCVMGVFIQAFMVGIVFAKLSRPKKRAQTLLFSRSAVICHRDGIPCLMFRVGDMRKSHIIEAHVRAQIIRKKITKEGEILPFFQQELMVGSDGGEDRLMFIWPTTIVHKIDRHSPLYALSARDMIKERFEIVVMLEGVVESTGMTTQARSSYLPSEVLWGHRFEHVVSFKKETGEYEVDYTLFNNTYEVETALCSAKQLDEVRAELHSPNAIERLCSVGLFPHASSTGSLDPHSDESIESVDRLQMRSHSITNSLPDATTLLSRTAVNNSITSDIGTENKNFINKKDTTQLLNSAKRNSIPRRLSIKQNILPADSIC